MLSTRAQAAERKSPDLLLWKVVQDLYHPQTNPSGILSLGIAENTLLHPSLSAHIQSNLTLPSPALTYGDGPGGSKRLKSALARFWNRRFHPVHPLRPEHVSITNGCSSAIEHLSWAFANPGDGFLLGRPYYGTFPADLSERPGAKVLPVSFHGVDPFCLDAVGKYEQALLNAGREGVKVAGLILCNPHNPLGRVYPRKVILELMRLCERHAIHFISDEIYALSVWDECPSAPFESCLSIPLEGVIDPARVHVVWGMSKDFGANGIRLGAIISQANPSLHAALVPINLYSSPSSISEHVAANILEDDAWVDAYVAENQRLLARHYALAVGWAREHGITYRAGTNAAFFLWVELGSVFKEHHDHVQTGSLNEIVRDELLRHKVFLASGEDFGSEEPGWFRIVFSHPEDYLREGLHRVIKAVKGA